MRAGLVVFDPVVLCVPGQHEGVVNLIGEAGTEYGIKVGAGTGAGIGAAILAQNYVYESKTPRFFAINAAYVVVGLGIMGTIIGVIQG